MKIGGNNPAQRAGRRRAGVGADRRAGLQLRSVYTPGEPPMDLSTYSGASDALDYLDGKRIR
jgi:flagellin